MSEARKAVFLSYASQDAEAAKRICEALRAAGVEVWFDQSELVGGDAWDQKIRKQIKECALLIPIVSQNTQARTEGYFRLEWRLADQRTHLMAKGRAFLLPVVIDDTKDADAHVPDSFTEVQWTRLKEAETPSAFCERVKVLLEPRRSHAAASRNEAGDPPDDDVVNAALTPGKRTPWPWLALAIGVAVVTLSFWQPWRTDRAESDNAVTVAEGTGTPSKADELVVRARALYEPWDLASTDDFKLAERLLKEATDLEPLNTEAWVSLAILSYGQDVFGYDANDARAELLRLSVEHARKLAPNSDRSKLVLALWYRQSPGTLPDALAILRDLAEQHPGDRFIAREFGQVLRRSGHHEEALTEFARAAALPGGDVIARGLRGHTLTLLGRLDEAQAEFEQVVREQPEYAHGYLALLEILFFQRGDIEGVKVVLRQVPARIQNDERVAALMAYMWYLGREPDRATTTLNRVTRDYIEGYPFRLPKSYLAGHFHRLAGRAEAAVAEWQVARAVIARRLEKNPTDLSDLYVKAELEALLGERVAAEASLRVFEQLQATRPASNILTWQIYTELERENDLADYFAQISQQKGSDDANQVAPLAALFRYHPLLDRYREHPRFKALAAEADRILEPHGAKVSSATPDLKSVAVLPFANLSGDPAQEYFSDGLTEEILNTLARERDLRVVPRTSAFSFKGRNLPLAEIARALNVVQVVEGSVQRIGDRLRIRCTVTRVADGFSEAVPPFDRDIRDGADLFAAQDQVAAAVLRKITARDPATRAEVPTRNLAAFDAYLRGRAAPSAGSHGVRESIGFFEMAVELDPTFALAWARLAEAQVVVYGWGSADSSEELLARAQRSLQHAFDLEPELPEALLARARFALVTRNLAALRRDLDRVDAIQPGLPEASFLRAFVAAVDERDWPAAAAHAREALARDPKNGDWANMLAVNVFVPTGDFPTADRLYGQVEHTSPRAFNNRVILRIHWRGPAAALELLERSPAAARNLETDTWRGLLLWRMGRVAEARGLAIALVEAVAKADPANFEPRDRLLQFLELVGNREATGRLAAEELERWERVRRSGNETAQVIAAIAAAHLAAGCLEEAQRVLRSWRPPEAESIDVRRLLRVAPALARVGETERAIGNLQAAAAAGYVHGHWLRFEPGYAGLYDDARFTSMMEAGEAAANAQPDPID